MRILVIGGGGREHALCWKIAKSPKREKLYCAPGNGGISQVAQLVNISADDVGSLLKFAKENKIDLTVVGPEAPLAAGIVDAFRENNLRIFGPSKDLARLEASKVFAKELMKRFNIPTADFRVFDNADEAIKYLDMKGAPVVVKADGLCAGKGVVVAKSVNEAKAAVKSMMIDKIFGSAGERILVEDCLTGEEASIIVISDGNNVVPLASSQDHKRIFNGDKGPNTGGMGAYSPAPVVTDALLKRVLDEIVYPVIKGLANEGRPYAGALYAGIMITASGPKLLEFNVRFGDPETQAILPRLKSDLVEAIERAIDGRLENYSLEWDRRFCVSVTLVSGGYPGDYVKGMEINGLEQAAAMKDIVVFHAGTMSGRRSADRKGLFFTTGGRVLNVTALGIDIKSAIGCCYNAVQKIKFDKMYYRTDIGHRAAK